MEKGTSGEGDMGHYEEGTPGAGDMGQYEEEEENIIYYKIVYLQTLFVNMVVMVMLHR